jgi:hypothetical protein
MGTKTLHVQSASAVEPEPYVFPKKEWTFRGHDPQTMKIEAIPGSWTPIPEKLKVTLKDYHGFASCPSCQGVSLFHKNVTTVDNDGRVHPDFQCNYMMPHNRQRCEFHRVTFLDLWNDKPLYACCILRGGRREMLYTHASTQAEARTQLGPGDYTIVAIGRAIGWFVEDKKGDVLSAD